jgi:WD40 repeat protein
LVVPESETDGSWELTSDGQSLIGEKAAESEKSPGLWQPSHVDVYELPSGRWRAQIADPMGLGRFSAAPSGQHIVCQARDGSWRIYHAFTGKMIGAIPPIQDAYVEWSPNGRFLALLDQNRGVTIVRAESAKTVHRFDHPTSIRFTPSGRELIAASKTGNVDVWELEPFRCVDSMPSPYPSSGEFDEHTKEPPRPGTANFRKLSCSFDGQQVVALFNRYEPEGDGLAAISCISCWNRSSRRRAEVEEGNYDIQHSGDLKVSANGRYISHAGWYSLGTFLMPDWLRRRDSDRHRAHFWEIVDKPEVKANALSIDQDDTPALDPTGRRFVTAMGGRVNIYNANDLSLIRSLNADLRSSVSDFAANGDYLAMCFRPDKFAWLPAWLPAQIRNLVSPESALAIVRLADGTTTRTLNYRDSAKFTADGNVWTLRFRQFAGKNGREVTLERWSPEAPRPPWWLWLMTLAGSLWMMRRWRGCDSSVFVPSADHV